MTKSSRDRAEEEAAVWLVLLSEEPGDAALRARFEVWLAAEGLNAEIWARTSRAYDLAGKGPPSHREHWESFAARRRAEGTRQAAGRSAARRVVVGATALAAAICLMVVAGPGLLLRMEADYVTAAAQLHAVMLDDGSRVRLAPESAIDIAFADGERRVRLLKGEAFFDVAPDAAHPFRVVAGDTVATVLGTAFEMRLGPDGAAVAVQHGQVRVDDGHAWPPVSEHLGPGDWLRVARSAGISRGSTRPEEVADWIGGEMVARDRPIGEIVDELRRYYKGLILMRDDDFARRRVSGIYALHDPAATLRGLAASHGAVVRQISPWLLVVTAD